MFSFYSILPSDLPATAKPARGKGVRSTGARSATHPCGAAGASGIAMIVVSFCFSRARRIVTRRAETLLRLGEGAIRPSRAWPKGRAEAARKPETSAPAPLTLCIIYDTHHSRENG